MQVSIDRWNGYANCKRYIESDLLQGVIMKIPMDLVLHKKSHELEIVYDDMTARLTFEYLRVHSPSAEVKGHAPGQDVLQVGKKNVDIVGLEPVGNYAIKIRYSDGHDSGIYSWDYLESLIVNHDKNWTEYLQRLVEAGASREGDLTPELKAKNATEHCGCKK